jgi:hypothetical protein
MLAKKLKLVDGSNSRQQLLPDWANHSGATLANQFRQFDGLRS